jgi:phenylpyruvate tautomerase PptA (4-oxalocrotonate tautomerase family)
MADDKKEKESNNKKAIVVHNTAEFLDAVKSNPDGTHIIFDEAVGMEGYGMAALAMKHAEAMFNKAQTTLDKLDPLVKLQKKHDLDRLMLLKKEQKKFVNKVNKQAQRR